MRNAEKIEPAERSSVTRGRFQTSGLVLAVVAAPAIGLIYAWIAQMVEPYFAPLILFPLLIGVAVGLTMIGLVRFARRGHRPTIFAATVAAALIAATGQHYFSYLDAYDLARPVVGSIGQDLLPLLQKAKPSFGRYMEVRAERGRAFPGGYVARGTAAWFAWAIDALLVAGAAAAVVWPGVHVPYCNRCSTWYRTVRSGRIDVPTAQRLAEHLGAEEFGAMRSPRYRLQNCQSGCGPTQFELSWQAADGGIDLVRVWLDVRKRSEVVAILDGLPGESKGLGIGD